MMPRFQRMANNREFADPQFGSAVWHERKFVDRLSLRIGMKRRRARTVPFELPVPNQLTFGFEMNRRVRCVERLPSNVPITDLELMIGEQSVLPRGLRVDLPIMEASARLHELPILLDGKRVHERTSLYADGEQIARHRSHRHRQM